MELVDIRKASEALGVSINTLRRWDKQDKFKPFTRTSGGHRRYSRKQLNEYLGIRENDSEETRVCIYARVSTNKQKKSGNLDRQKNRLMEYSITNDYKIVEIYQEVASGVNENRSQLHKMLDNLDAVDRIIIEYKDRLARFGFKYLQKVAKAYSVKIEILAERSDTDMNEEMVNDLISIVTSFSARIYGARGGRAVKKTLNQLNKEDDNQ